MRFDRLSHHMPETLQLSLLKYPLRPHGIDTVLYKSSMQASGSGMHELRSHCLRIRSMQWDILRSDWPQSQSWVRRMQLWTQVVYKLPSKPQNSDRYISERGTPLIP